MMDTVGVRVGGNKGAAKVALAVVAAPANEGSAVVVAAAAAATSAVAASRAPFSAAESHNSVRSLSAVFIPRGTDYFLFFCA